MTKGEKIYNEMLDELKQECKELIKTNQMTTEDAEFRYDMVKDEILEGIPDELFTEEV